MRRALVALLTLLALLAGCASQPPATTVSPTASVWKGARLDRPYDLPDVTLTDQNGRPFALRTGSDKPVLVLFFASGLILLTRVKAEAVRARPV